MTTRQDNPTPIGATTNEEHTGSTISKRALKRQQKRQKVLDERPAKRAAERARKKAKKSNSTPNHAPLQENHHQDAQMHQVKPSTSAKPTIFPARVVFDCRFDDKMSKKEIVSLDRQIAHSYAINRRASVQFENLICTSFNGRLSERFESNGNQHLRWKSVKFTSASIEDLIPNDENETSQEQETEEAKKEIDDDPQEMLPNEECIKHHDQTCPPSPSSSLEVANQLTNFGHHQTISTGDRGIDSKRSNDNQHQEDEHLGHENHNEAPTKKIQHDHHPISEHSGNDANPGLNIQSKPSCVSIPAPAAGASRQQFCDNHDWVDFRNFNKSDLVYLTADSNNILTSIDPNKVYIVGSIVDHNRYKNLCLDLSDQLGVNHAQLPIGEYFSHLKTRKVLTVNQVFEILVRFLEVKDWKTAFEKVIPARKL